MSHAEHTAVGLGDLSLYFAVFLLLPACRAHRSQPGWSFVVFGCAAFVVGMQSTLRSACPQEVAVYCPLCTACRLRAGVVGMANGKCAVLLVLMATGAIRKCRLHTEPVYPWDRQHSVASTTNDSKLWSPKEEWGSTENKQHSMQPYTVADSRGQMLHLKRALHTGTM